MSLFPRPARLIARGVLTELWRRQDLWILVLLMGVFALVAISARVIGIENPASGTFMLNLGISLSSIFAQMLTLIVSVRQFPDEIEQRTLYPLLAKPLERGTLLLGKWIACTAGGTAVFALFFLIAWLASPHMEAYVPGTLLQHLLLQPLALAWVAALGIACSLSLPRGLSLLASGALVFAGGALCRVLQEKTALAHLLPRLDALNLATRYTDGIAPLPPAAWVAGFLYALLWTVACLGASHLLFRRRPL